MSRAFKYALVLWDEDKSKSVVSTQDIQGIPREGEDCDALWNKRPHRAKIVKLGNNKDTLEKCPLRKDGTVVKKPPRNPAKPECVADLKKEILAVNRDNKAYKAHNALQYEDDILHLDSVFDSRRSIHSPKSESGLTSPVKLNSSSAGPPQPESSLQNPKQVPASLADQLAVPQVTQMKSSFKKAAHDLLTTQSSSQQLMSSTASGGACCIFGKELAPHITPDSIAVMERIVACMKSSCVPPTISTSGSADSMRIPSRMVLSCDMPGKGKVELVPGSGVFIHKGMRDMYAARFSTDAREMMRQIIKLTFCDTPDYLRTATAKTIPEHILSAASAFVQSHYTGPEDEFPSSFTKVINNMCGNFRRLKESTTPEPSLKRKTSSTEAAQNNSSLQKRSESATPITSTPPKTPKRPTPSDRILRSASPKKSAAKESVDCENVKRNICSQISYQQPKEQCQALSTNFQQQPSTSTDQSRPEFDPCPPLQKVPYMQQYPYQHPSYFHPSCNQFFPQEYSQHHLYEQEQSPALPAHPPKTSHSNYYTVL